MNVHEPIETMQDFIKFSIRAVYYGNPFDFTHLIQMITDIPIQTLFINNNIWIQCKCRYLYFKSVLELEISVDKNKNRCLYLKHRYIYLKYIYLYFQCRNLYFFKYRYMSFKHRYLHLMDKQQEINIGK